MGRPNAGRGVMAKRKSGALLTQIRLARDGRVTLRRQLEDQLREAILAGHLLGGARLPSSRALAEELEVSRPTVIQALDGLVAEGFLETRHGSGTFVAGSIPAHLPHAVHREERGEDRATRPPNLSRMGRRFAGLVTDISAHEPRPFLPNVPAYDRFPFALWQKCVNRQTRQLYRRHMGYGDPAGFAPLRRAIAEYLALHRGDDCDAEQIVITPGGHAAFMIAALVLTDPGDGILFEDPGPLIACKLFQSLGRNLVLTPVDCEGMDFAEAAGAARPRMAFTMPSRQHPLGRTLSLARRIGLLEWAERTDAWIVEDDYDTEFRYTSRPLPSIRSIDRFGRVIYVGTFSKALFPALRVGYFVLPPALVGPFRNAVALMLRGPPMATQMALAEFIAEGHFATHLRRMRDLYATRRQDFLDEAARVGTGLFAIERPDSGMNALAWLPAGIDDRAVARAALAAGVHSYPLSDYCLLPGNEPALILGFAGVQHHQLGPGLAALARVVADQAGGG